MHSKKKARFTSPIFSDWFHKHFDLEVRHYQENVLRIAPEEANALLIQDSSSAHKDAEKLVGADGKICTMFLPPLTYSQWISEKLCHADGFISGNIWMKS